MTNKYIVNGCPAYHCGGCYYDGAKFECCSKNDNCSIKQIVTLCKADSEIAKYVTGRKTPPALNQSILQLLEVNEVE